MPVVKTLLVLAGLWLIVAAIGRLLVVPFLERGPGGKALNGLLWWVARAYCRIWHRVRFTGTALLPRSDADHGGLVVVANHTGAVDPLLVQVACRFLIRWMMAEDMMSPVLDWLWRDEYMIPVDREGPDTRSLREAIRYVRAGGALGVFPEGRITTPPREIRPFLPGVGLLVTRTKAPVLLVWISGTPDTNKMGESLATRSHARVEFIDLMRFDDERDPAAVTEHLRRRIAEVSGWPLNDEVLPPGGPPEP